MQRIIKFSKIKNGKYQLVSGNMTFETNLGIMELTPEQGLEIAFTLFDDFMMDYDVLYELEDRIKKKGGEDESNTEELF